MADTYYDRICDRILSEKLEAKGAVLVKGAKWCGKTTTAAHIAKSVIYMEDPSKKKQYLAIADMDPAQLLQGEVPHLIDEWQLAPKLWDAIRFEVDQRDDFGQFILTGSAVPPDLSEISHTGTGRITSLLMRPMSLFESGESNGSVSLRGLFSKEHDVNGIGEQTLEDIAFLICRGGWPKAIGRSKKIALAQAPDYYDAVVESDISRVDNVVRDANRARRVLRAYARSVASEATIASILNDVKEDEADSFSENTLRSYISALKKIFVIEDTPAWNPNLRSKTAARSSDTRYFVDPSIATAALGIGPNDLINDLATMGLIFENLCVRDLRVYAESLDGNVYHYRDKSGLECDTVIHLKNGRYGLVEIKLGGDKLIEEGAANLLKLKEKIDTDKMGGPAFMMVLCAVAPFAYKRRDGVFVVPIGCLRN
ncbi:MAG: ATP-binding protein [Lachnospiraceae bacterium]|nr:ATP-binding protein [Lachnospiraceae bacterium]